MTKVFLNMATSTQALGMDAFVNDSHHLNASHWFPVQNNGPSTAIREDADSRTAYSIRHTALSRTYAIVACVRHNNNAGSPVFGIPGLPHWPESSQFQMKLQYAWNQRTTHPFLWFKTHRCEWSATLMFVIYYQKHGSAYRQGWTNHNTLHNGLLVGPTKMERSKLRALWKMT